MPTKSERSQSEIGSYDSTDWLKVIQRLNISSGKTLVGVLSTELRLYSENENSPFARDEFFNILGQVNRSNQRASGIVT